jgi:RNA polymerase sigma factor (sigma-70 family)
MGRYCFWIYNKDDKGRPLDENIVKAAEEVTPTLTRYRYKEIGCESMINSMLQSAVEAASKAVHKNPIMNPAGYVVSVYERIVDRWVEREKRVVCVDDAFLEHLANGTNTVSFEELIHDQLVLRKLIDNMDPDTRQIFIWRMQGYSVNEIAKELSVTPNCVSVRHTRGVKKAIKKVLGTTRNSKKNK